MNNLIRFEKQIRQFVLPGLIILTSSVLLLPATVHSQSCTPEGDDIWTGAYLASWEHFAPPTGNWGHLPTGQIDWEAITHLYYFAITANYDGTLPDIEPYQNMGPDRINAIINAAHQNNTPVLLSVGGWGNYEAFSSAISENWRKRFIYSLINMMTRWGFDGIDIDMEPIRDSDIDNYNAFISDLHAEAQKINTPLCDAPLLTAATSWQPGLFAGLQHYFDQINLMTYDFSGAWDGWVTWHNSPVYSGGLSFPGRDGELPSVDRQVQEFLSAGVDPGKLGIGIDFYGYIWKGGQGTDTGGATRPNQTWNTPPTVTDNVPYRTIMDNYFSEEAYHWDEAAGAAYLSIDQPGSSSDKFITFDDENVIKEKIGYLTEHQLGGVFVWELSGAYMPEKPPRERDLLLTYLKETVANRDSLFPDFYIQNE